MTNVVVTGGAGFLGARLARELLAARSLTVAGSGSRPLSRLTLVDRAPPPPDLAADGPVAAIRGDLGRPAGPGPRRAGGAGQGRRDLPSRRGGQRRNARPTSTSVSGRTCASPSRCSRPAARSGRTRWWCSRVRSRCSGRPPSTRSRPWSTTTRCRIRRPATGSQKFIGEQLVADYTRKGFLRGRSVRLMTVSVRPGRPNAAASGFMSGIIREPLAGPARGLPGRSGHRGGAGLARPGPSRRCAAPLSSSGRGLGRPDRGDHARPHGDGRGHGRRAGAGGRAGGDRLIDWVPDPVVAGMVSGWAARFHSDRASRPRPDPRPGLHLDHPPAPSRDPPRPSAPATHSSVITVKKWRSASEIDRDHRSDRPWRARATDQG